MKVLPSVLKLSVLREKCEVPSVLATATRICTIMCTLLNCCDEAIDKFIVILKFNVNEAKVYKILNYFLQNEFF